MPKTATRTPKRKILLAESDVIVRLGLAQHLRACAHVVLEACDANEATAILQAGQDCDVLLCDPQLTGADSGFGVAKWVRRNRSQTRVILAATLPAKALAAVELCGSEPDEAPGDAAAFVEKIRLMQVRRSRRLRRPASTAAAKMRPRAKRAPS